ncbi:MAG: thioredoxin domain-containing protein, partial [Candidatus Brocadiae bacterium]|nr:thioredoxin domain-containing protein [Candidatus Brocadiia bacterium]
MAGTPTPTHAKKTQNHLAKEKSPYLLQHADNPVDWYPWGDEAFGKARKEDKPIFLSIGYSTCHWCHVMEHESFEDEEAARLLNEAFVCVKVDREERPDIDNVYMAVCQMMTGSGGWPLTIIMTPDKRPFFAATYIPKRARMGRTGLMELVPRVVEVWKSRRADIEKSTEQIARALDRLDDAKPGAALGEATLTLAYNQLEQRFDEQHGGFNGAPKFPTPHNLFFLLRYWRRSGNARALAMVEKTLQSMRDGGIYDHVGFGFHRYATDPRWLVPHFEKMLYDQALLAMAYTEAHQATGKDEYARTTREILTYVLRDMTAPAGGFYCAEDADSEGEEGQFYLWTRDEVQQVLGDDAALAIEAFNIQEKGNTPAHPGGPKPGLNILHRTQQLAGLAAGGDALEAARQKLFAIREKRVYPGKDDKILTDWNGLMIAAFAKAARALDEPRYAQAASRAAAFVLKTLRTPDGRLLHRYRDGQAGLPAHADDYAFFVWGLLELYEATFDTSHLEAAIALTDRMLRHYWDEKGGGFFFPADDGEKLLVRTKEVYDGALPSANSVAILNLLRLSRITGRIDLAERADAISRAFSKGVARAPVAHTQLLVALDFGVGPSHEVVIAGKSEAADTEAMVRALRTQFLPNTVVLLRPTGSDDPPITRIATFTKAQVSVNGKATAYVCRNGACERPQTSVEKMLALVRKVE